jgi:hypothetical protein
MKAFVALIACLAPAFASLQPAKTIPKEPPQATAPRDPSGAWQKRLGALSPDRPMDYFLLAEDVGADATEDSTRDLARQLYVLAYELDARTSGRKERFQLGPSVCLGLASLASRDDERRWLRALAETLTDRTPALGSSTAGNTGGFARETAFDLATAMGLARSGEGRRAEQLLDKPGVSELLERIEAQPMPDGSLNDLKGFFKRAIRDWPICPQCRNRRVVPAGSNRNGEMVLCDTCRGNPGPKLSEQELANQLRIEAVLLQGTQRSWAAQVLADAGAPLRDLDPSELAGTYKVDPDKPLWRDGGWTAAAGSAAPAGEEKPGG